MKKLVWFLSLICITSVSYSEETSSEKPASVEQIESAAQENLSKTNLNYCNSAAGYCADDLQISDVDVTKFEQKELPNQYSLTLGEEEGGCGVDVDAESIEKATNPNCRAAFNTAAQLIPALIK